MLRPEMMSVPQLLRQLADSCESGEMAADYVVIGLFLQNGQVKNICKASPMHCAFFASHLISFSAAMSVAGPVEPLPGKYVR